MKLPNIDDIIILKQKKIISFLTIIIFLLLFISFALGFLFFFQVKTNIEEKIETSITETKEKFISSIENAKTEAIAKFNSYIDKTLAVSTQTNIENAKKEAIDKFNSYIEKSLGKNTQINIASLKEFVQDIIKGSVENLLPKLLEQVEAKSWVLIKKAQDKIDQLFNQKDKEVIIEQIKEVFAIIKKRIEDLSFFNWLKSWFK